MTTDRHDPAERNMSDERVQTVAEACWALSPEEQLALSEYMLNSERPWGGSQSSLMSGLHDRIAALEAALRGARRQHDSRCEEYRQNRVGWCACGALEHNARIDAVLGTQP